MRNLKEINQSIVYFGANSFRISLQSARIRFWNMRNFSSKICKRKSYISKGLSPQKSTKKKQQGPYAMNIGQLL